jgi:hypothetical protein
MHTYNTYVIYHTAATSLEVGTMQKTTQLPMRLIASGSGIAAERALLLHQC